MRRRRRRAARRDRRRRGRHRGRLGNGGTWKLWTWRRTAGRVSRWQPSAGCEGRRMSMHLFAPRDVVHSSQRKRQPIRGLRAVVRRGLDEARNVPVSIQSKTTDLPSFFVAPPSFRPECRMGRSIVVRKSERTRRRTGTAGHKPMRALSWNRISIGLQAATPTGWVVGVVATFFERRHRCWVPHGPRPVRVRRTSRPSGIACPDGREGPARVGRPDSVPSTDPAHRTSPVIPSARERPLPIPAPRGEQRGYFTAGFASL